MAKELSEGVRGEIMALIKEGLSHRQIAARMRVSKGAVQRTAERFTRTNAYSTLPRSGRPKCTTPQQDRFIKITSLRNRRATAGNIQALVNATGGKTISKTTVRRRLAACGLKGRVAVSKPLLRFEAQEIAMGKKVHELQYTGCLKKMVIELWSAIARSLYNLQKSLFHSRKDQAFSFRMSPFL